MTLQNKFIKDYRKLFCLLKDGTTFTAIDTETTGLSSQTDRIIEIGAVKFNKDGLISEFSKLINPERPIPFSSTQIHHITNKMVQNEQPIKNVLPDFLDFLGDSILIGHNVNFDLRFLNAELTRNGFPEIENSLIDTLRLCRWTFPELEKYNQVFMAEKFNLQIKNAHRAFDDAFICGQIFLNCIKSSAQLQKI